MLSPQGPKWPRRRENKVWKSPTPFLLTSPTQRRICCAYVHCCSGLEVIFSYVFWDPFLESWCLKWTLSFEQHNLNVLIRIHVQYFQIAKMFCLKLLVLYYDSLFNWRCVVWIECSSLIALRMCFFNHTSKFKENWRKQSCICLWLGLLEKCFSMYISPALPNMRKDIINPFKGVCENNQFYWKCVSESV